MALPNTIANGQIPDAGKLMENFNWLAAGKGIKTAAYGELKAAAQSSPAEPFICWAADIKQLLVYCGDDALGDGGFIILGGA